MSDHPPRRILRALRRATWLVTKLALFAAGAVVVAAFSAWSVIDREFRESDVVVPKVMGQGLDEATATLAAAGLELRVDGHRFHDAPAGTVYYQEPVAGSRTRRLRGVKVLISRGTNSIPVPDLTGQTARGASIVLSGVDLALGKVSRVHSQVTASHVVAQDPPPGAAAFESQPVDVLVSIGPNRRSFVMPDLRGADVRRARGLLAVAGLDSVEVRHDPSAATGASVVASQYPAPGTRVERDTAISLVVGVAR